ncbi:MAG: ABC transporter substrate-binding protein [Treponema sp.]|jgi:peptide/nickel transport system substrate-binding protein|nr:ABC transporter substrate-binding protein [Treponema sp.]
MKTLLRGKCFFIPVLLLAGLVSLAALGKKDTGARGQAELRYGFTSEPATLDPLSSSNTADGRSILFNVYEGLVKPDSRGLLQPAAAESWSVEEGGRRYRFVLRKGLRFSNGQALGSADAVFSINKAIEAKFQGFTQIEKVETPDEAVLLITLKEPDPEFLPYLTIGIVPADNPDREKNPVGSGPFMIQSYAAQQSLVLVKNPHYRQPDLPKLDRVTIVFLADSDALSLALQGGNIDGASVTGSIVEQLDPERFDIIPGFSNAVQLLALNNSAKPLDDIRVRQAINYAVGRKAVIDTAFYGRGEPSGSPLIPGLAQYYDASLRDPYPFDAERARRLLAEAGYGEGGQKLSLEITAPSNYSMHVDTAQVIVNQLAAVGITASIKLIDWASWLSETYRGRKYEATIISLDASNISPRSFLSRYHSGNGSNFINYKSDAYDRSYDAAQREPDEGKRIELYKECQRIMNRDAASVFIQDIMSFKAFSKGRFGGSLNYPLYVIDFSTIYRN